jgi:CheY-like chemotaxis protein
MFRSLEHGYIKPKIDKVFADLDDREPVFGMYINCAGRCAGYAGTEMEDALYIQQSVAGRVPVLGLYNGVEIAPIGGRSRGLDWTGVFCLFSQSKDGNGNDGRASAVIPVWEMSSIVSSTKEVSLNAMIRINEQNAAKILALDTMCTALRLELEQKRRGFSLLAELTASLRQNVSYERVFIPVASHVNAALNMQRTAVLKKNEDGLFSAVVLHGYSANEKAAFADRRFDVPPEWLDPDNPVLVTGADPADRFQELRESLGLPYFVASPIMLQGDVFAILITGRLVEAPPYLVRLGQSDIETVRAVCAFMASALVEQRLAESDERTRIMIDALPVSCVFWDEYGLSDCNQATLTLFGLSTKSELIARLFDLLPEYQPDGQRSVVAVQDTIRQAFVTGELQSQWILQTASGEIFPAEITLIRVPKGDGYTLAGYIRDLRDSQAAEKLAKAKDNFPPSVSHEVRTPPNVIQSTPRGDSGLQGSADLETLRGMRVLVAEDNQINQLVMKEFLSAVGIEVTMADNGIRALEKLQEGTFDLILMDIQMPEMDGLTATAQIRADSRYESLPILAVTANAGADFGMECLRAGMNDYLTKPLDTKKLYDALKKWGKRNTP